VLTPNFSDALLAFLYGVMVTLFVQWVLDRFELRERVRLLEMRMLESSCRLFDCEEDVKRCWEAQRLVGVVRTQLDIANQKPSEKERRTRARSLRRAKK
jgi:hypothetical protein